MCVFGNNTPVLNEHLCVCAELYLCVRRRRRRRPISLSRILLNTYYTLYSIQCA